MITVWVWYDRFGNHIWNISPTSHGMEVKISYSETHERNSSFNKNNEHTLLSAPVMTIRTCWELTWIKGRHIFISTQTHLVLERISVLKGVKTKHVWWIHYLVDMKQLLILKYTVKLQNELFYQEEVTIYSEICSGATTWIYYQGELFIDYVLGVAWRSN